MHGAVAWRMRLPAWRGAYAADALGWHDRARTHFSSYALSQVTTPATGPVVFDTALHLARQLEKMGTSMFSSGYICRNPNGDLRPHHYDMNLVFIDQLLTHFYYTGDTRLYKTTVANFTTTFGLGEKEITMRITMACMMRIAAFGPVTPCNTAAAALRILLPIITAPMPLRRNWRRLWARILLLIKMRPRKYLMR